MSVLTVQPSPLQEKTQTVQDLLNALGNIPPERIRIHPAPGTAVEQDVIDAEARENRLFELVDATLVEKAMGYHESLLAMIVGSILLAFVEENRLGTVTGSDGALRLFPGLVRIPDVAFVSFTRMPGQRVPNDAIPSMIPDLAVEVLSKTNTPGEMRRKRIEYFETGVRLVWLFDLVGRFADVYTAPEQVTRVEADGVLSGGEVLPGLTISMSELFARFDRSLNG
ncbi:MAG TPA: Uma2 family endonuclease [Tepidisphaeraceae bacterium]|jgi:Uma2 family endonuclease